MNRCRIWVLLLVLGLLFLVVGAIFVYSDIKQHRMALRESFHEKCLLQTATFEEYAERWIVRGQLDFLQASAQLLLMGSGLYVDVMLQDEILYSGSDPDLGAEALPEPVAFDPALKEGVASFLPNGSVEVNSPLILSGYKDIPIGLIRIGFSGGYVNSEIRSYALVRTGFALGIWLAVMTGVVLSTLVIRKRTKATDEFILRCGTLQIDTRSCEVRLRGRAIELTPKLYELILFFARSPGAIFTDKDILEAIWAGSTYAASPDVKQHIYLLRRKLSVAHPDPKCVIVNVKGFGYRFDPPMDDEG